MSTLPVGRLELSQVPEPPEGAERNYGEGMPFANGVPYANGGYFIDGVIDGFPVRWRYDNRGLMHFLVYWPDNAPRPQGPWRSWWSSGLTK